MNAMKYRYPPDNDWNNQHRYYEQYAVMMEDIHNLYPNNLDVAAMYAESLMVLQCSVTRGYVFYDDNGNPVGNTTKATKILEGVLAKTEHPFAEHLYIHIVEPSNIGPKGTFRAYDEGKDLQENYKKTQAQHLQHMPAHIYLRTGHWYEIVNASITATNSDALYLTHGSEPYGPGHNTVFLIYGACMSGMSKVAMQYGQHEQDLIMSDPTREDDPPYEQAWNTLLTTYVRFGLWDTIIDYKKEPPVSSWIFPKILRAYAEGLAYLNTNSTDEAEKQLQIVVDLKDKVATYLNGVTTVALNILQGAIQWRKKSYDDAVNSFQVAIKEQGSWGYQEPPRWHFPTTECL
eukprot:UN34153